MDKLYYAGIALQKDLEFCEILEEIENTHGVYVISKPDPYTVIEMKYKNAYNSEREETGNTHTGYYYHYITFLYEGYIFSINPSSYYPFTDSNDPGKWNFTVFNLVSPIQKQQASYNYEYKNINSIKDMISSRHGWNALRGTNKQYINIGVTSNTEIQIKSIVNRYGGYREREILNGRYFLDKAETWNNDHKVINVLNVTPDADGYRAGFAVDLVTGDICG